MFGLGTAINVAAIVAGGIIGLLFGIKFLSSRVQNSLLAANGVCVAFIGVAGTLQEMLTFSDGRFGTKGILMMIVCFALGTIVGELLDIEKRIEDFGVWLKKKSGSQKDNQFIDGFMTATLTVCIGAMAVIGSIDDGIRGNITTLVAKSLLDFIIVMIMASSMGRGCVFSAVPVGIFQGTITLLAHWIEPLMTAQALSNISLTGSVMIFCVGINIAFGKKFSVANMLPTLLFAVGWAFL